MVSTGEQAEAAVAVLAKSTAVAAEPVRPGQMHALSPLDHAMACHSVRMVFYYRSSPALTREKLKDSLSEVLSYYPTMTGRLVQFDGEGRHNKWLVKCNDAGVRTVDAKVKLTLREWLDTATDTDEDALCYWEPMGDGVPFLWSPFYIQMTEFADGSFSIGLSCSHMHADPTCAGLFFNAWADVHRRAAILFPPFLHQHALVPTATDRSSSSPFLERKSKLPEAGAGNAVAMSSATFLFPADAVRRCVSSLGGGGVATVSPFAALASLFWLRVATADGTGGKRELTLALHMRKRMHAPLPTNFFGNAVHFTQVTADLAEGWSAVAAEVQRRVAAVHEDEFWTALEWLDKWQRESTTAFQMYGPELTCVELDDLAIGGARFDAAAAAEHVSCRVGGGEGEGTIIVMPLAEAMDEKERGDGVAGRAVVVSLPSAVTTAICRDGRILELGPKVVSWPKA